MAKATGITLSRKRDEPAFGLQVETESNGSIHVLTTLHTSYIAWLKKANGLRN